MAVSIETLGSDPLGVAERLELIGKTWDSLPEQVAPGHAPVRHAAERARRPSAERLPADDRQWGDMHCAPEGRS